MINGDNAINKESWFRRFVDNTSLSKIIKELVTDIKDWVDLMINGHLYIHDGNWYKYIKPRPELKKMPSRNSITGSNYGYWVDLASVNENGEATPSEYGSGVYPAVSSISYDEFIEYCKNGDNKGKYLISLRCCELVLPSWARTVTFGCQYVNFEYLAIYPPKYDRNATGGQSEPGYGDGWTNNENCNGYRISVFQLPVDGMYTSSHKIDSTHKHVRRVVMTGSEVYDKTDLLPSSGSIYKSATAEKSIELSKLSENNSGSLYVSYKDKDGNTCEDGQIHVKLDGGGGMWLSSPKNFVNKLITLKDYSAFVYLGEVSSVNYYNSILPSNEGYLLQPGVIGDMVWFNGHWYLGNGR